MAEAKYGTADSWSEWDDAEVILDKYILPEIKGAKKYGKAVNAKLPLCYDSNNKLHNSGSNKASQYIWLDGVVLVTPFLQYETASFKLPDGNCIGLNPYHEFQNPDTGTLDKRFAYNIFIDINGSNPPNIAGEDLFFFVVDKNTVKPYGFNYHDEIIYSTASNACNRKAPCGGYTCAARIMRDGWEIKY